MGMSYRNFRMKARILNCLGRIGLPGGYALPGMSDHEYFDRFLLWGTIRDVGRKRDARLRTYGHNATTIHYVPNGTVPSKLHIVRECSYLRSARRFGSGKAVKKAVVGEDLEGG